MFSNGHELQVNSRWSRVSSLSDLMVFPLGEALPREGQIRIRAEEVGPADRDNQAGRSAASNLSDIGSLRSEMELQRSQSPLTLQVKKNFPKSQGFFQ